MAQETASSSGGERSQLKCLCSHDAKTNNDGKKYIRNKSAQRAPMRLIKVAALMLLTIALVLGQHQVSAQRGDNDRDNDDDFDDAGFDDSGYSSPQSRDADSSQHQPSEYSPANEDDLDDDDEVDESNAIARIIAQQQQQQQQRMHHNQPQQHYAPVGQSLASAAQRSQRFYEPASAVWNGEPTAQVASRRIRRSIDNSLAENDIEDVENDDANQKHALSRQKRYAKKKSYIGPVYTYVKTDKHAHYKWGVKHKVGKHYG